MLLIKKMSSVYVLETTCKVPCQRTSVDGAAFEPRAIGRFRPYWPGPAMRLTSMYSLQGLRCAPESVILSFVSC